MVPLLLIVVLTCAGGTEPGNCTRATALDVRIVGRTAMPTACMLGGMMTAAREQEGVGGQYCLIRCERS